MVELFFVYTKAREYLNSASFLEGARPPAALFAEQIRAYPRCGGARNAPLNIIQTMRLSSQRAIHYESHWLQTTLFLTMRLSSQWAIHYESHWLQTTLFLTIRLSSQWAIHFASRACRRSGS